jgi:hypothetical protein
MSAGLGVALGIAQIGWQFARKKPIETMERLSLFLVVSFLFCLIRCRRSSAIPLKQLAGELRGRF